MGVWGTDIVPVVCILNCVVTKCMYLRKIDVKEKPASNSLQSAADFFIGGNKSGEKFRMEKF
jgi:hypothetical protein